MIFEVSFLIILILFSTLGAENNGLEDLLFIISSITGPLITMCISKCFKKIPGKIFSALIIGASGGLSAGLLLYNTIIYKINGGLITFWLLLVLSSSLHVILTIYYNDHMLIHSTAMAGSFWFIFGIGLVAGHYQNPFLLPKFLSTGYLTSIDPLFYAYLAANLILYGLGCAWQYHKLKL